jgi:enoyl-[acyl-carrier-protein] reductase (NADH)
MAAAVTGEIIFVDSGYNILGVPFTSDDQAS